LIDWSLHKSVMDVGGGYGACIELIQKKNTGIECILFDLPDVVENVKSPSLKKIAGSFFEPFSLTVDSIILSRVIHDWPEDKARVILKNTHDALLNYGTLYLIENCSDLITTNLSLLSLNMLVMCESQERSSDEYKLLCEQAGFSFDSQIKLNDLQTIMIFKK
jgi:C-methyltransferase